MAGSATVSGQSGQWATAQPGVEMPHGSPGPHNCRLALAEGQNFLVSRGRRWAWGLTVGPGRMGEDRGTPGGQGSRVHRAQELRAACFPVDWQQLGREDCATSGRPPSTDPTSPVALAAGIEMEIVNSCEADNGGCSHGCSHSSAGPVCTCPHGYELDEDQRTCIGASHLLPDCRPPSQRLAAALGQCPGLMP